jgi:hypothetical protein
VAPVLLRAKACVERMWLRMDAGRGSPLAARTRPPHRKPAAQGSFFLDHFFLLTNVPATEMAAETLLQYYRARDAAEKSFGKWQHSLDLSLSSPRAPQVALPRPSGKPRAFPPAPAQERGALWDQWWRTLERSYPARGSPNFQALPHPGVAPSTSYSTQIAYNDFHPESDFARRNDDIVTKPNAAA